MAQVSPHRSSTPAAKVLLITGAVGVLTFGGISAALAQEDDLYDDSPTGVTGIFGDEFPGSVLDDDFPTGIFDDHSSGDLNVGGNSGGSIMVGGNSGGGISIDGGAGLSAGGRE